MSTLKISRRYAKALLATATEKNIVDVVSTDMAHIGRIGEASKDLRAMMGSPIINVADKQKVLSEVLDGKVNPLIMDFLMLLLEKRRGSLFREIIREYGVMVDTMNNIERIVVTSAVKMAAPERAHLEQSLATKLKKNIVATFDIDPSILGGAIVRVGDDVMDGSLRHQLYVLRERLANG